MDFLTFQDLPEALKQQSRYLSLDKDQTLVHQNEVIDWLFWVRLGRIRIVSFVGEQMITQYFIEANHFFCESLLYTGRYECSAIAEVASQVIAIPKQRFAEALKENPALHSCYQANLAHKLHYIRLLLELRSIRPARNRLLRYLMTQRLPDQPTVIIKKPLREVASELDLTPEYLSRLIAQLQVEGEIIRKRRSFTFSQKVLDDCI